MANTCVADVSQDPLGENAEQQFDLAHPGGVPGREVELGAPTVLLIEGLPGA